MKFLSRVASAAALAMLCSCATLFPPIPQPGETEAQVIAQRGQPTDRYRDGNDTLLEYATGPWGQKTWMARFGPDGKLISFEQVLTSEKFATIKVGEATKADVLRTIGRPSETGYLPLSGLEVWSYPYKEAGTWDSLMHVHFDSHGIVRKMLNGPDPKFDPDRRFPIAFR